MKPSPSQEVTRLLRAWSQGDDAALDEALGVERGEDLDVIALDLALECLAKVNRRQSRVVELRYFGGLSVEETAEVLKVSADTVMRDWRFAKAWLKRELVRGAAA